MVGVCLLLATVLPFSELDYRVVADYDFNELTNARGNSVEITDNFSALVPGFSGSKLYIPAMTNGVLQISSSSNRGRLICSNENVSADCTMFIRASKMNKTPQKTKLSIGPYGESPSGSATNLTVTFEMDWLEPVALSTVATDGSIIIQPNDETESNRRILIDRIIFARKREHGFYFIIR